MSGNEYPVLINSNSQTLRMWVAAATLAGGPATFTVLRNGVVVVTHTINNGATGDHSFGINVPFTTADRVSINLAQAGATGTLNLSGTIYFQS